MPSRMIVIPEELCRRFDKVSMQVYNLPSENVDIFWDDLITAMESRIKVLQK